VISSSQRPLPDNTKNSQQTQSVGLLWTSDQLVAETSTWQHKKLTTDTVCRTPLDEWSARRRDLYLTTQKNSQQTSIHASDGIRTHSLSRRETADLRLRPRGYWNRHLITCACRKLGTVLVHLMFTGPCIIVITEEQNPTTCNLFFHFTSYLRDSDCSPDTTPT